MLRVSDIVNVLRMEQAIEAGGGSVRNPTPNPMGLEDHGPAPDPGVVLHGLDCTHPHMHECHPGCGHLSCPDCGLEWDDHAGH